jgi:hypothetical protein
MIVKMTAKPAQGDFQTRRCLIIFNQQICDAHGMWIQRTANGNPKPAKTDAPQILHQSDKPCVADGKFHTKSRALPNGPRLQTHGG